MKYAVLYDTENSVGLDQYAGFEALFSTKKKAKRHAKWRAKFRPGVRFVVVKVIASYESDG